MTTTAWLTPHAEGNFALLRLVAPADAPVATDYAQDVYFLIDRSSSMEGIKWERACLAFLKFLEQLHPRDRVWATFFNNRYQDFAEHPLPPQDLLADPAVQKINRMGVDGGTELLPAFEHVLQVIKHHSAGRHTTVLLITDGQVGNEAQITELLRPHPAIRVHTFGIDTAVNDAFLRSLARQQRGSCHLVTPNEDLATLIARLGQRLRRPVLTHIRVAPGWESPGGELPDLHAGETVAVALRSRGPAAPIEWQADRPDGTVASFRCEVRQGNFQALPLVWARHRIDHLLSHGEPAEAFVVAKQWNLACAGAAFVAWDADERLVIGQEKLDLYQPAFRATLNCILFGGEASQEPDALAQLDMERSVARNLHPSDPGRRPRLILPPAWKLQLLEDPLFANRIESADLVEALERWAKATPHGRWQREQKLGELARLFWQLRGEGKDTTQVVAAARHWMELNLPPEVLSAALKGLERLASTILA
jgi:Ca-activated chloride channel family protein